MDLKAIPLPIQVLICARRPSNPLKYILSSSTHHELPLPWKDPPSTVVVFAKYPLLAN